MTEVGVNEELSSGNHPFSYEGCNDFHSCSPVLNLMDKRFNKARYSRATVSMHG
jgi:hypothetical protein